MGPGGYDARSERSLRVRAPTVQVGDPYPGAGQPGNAGRSKYHFYRPRASSRHPGEEMGHVVSAEGTTCPSFDVGLSGLLERLKE